MDKQEIEHFLDWMDKINASNPMQLETDNEDIALMYLDDHKEKVKTYTLDEITDEIVGKKGTPDRDSFDEDLKKDIEYLSPNYYGYNGGFWNVNKCNDCNLTGMYEDLHEADCCPKCGGKVVRNGSAKWINGKWMKQQTLNFLQVQDFKKETTII